MNTTSITLPQLIDLVRGQHDTPFLVILAAFLVYVLSLVLLRGSSDGHIIDLGGFPVTTAWKFFSKRHEFMVSNLKKAGGLPFRFRVLQVRAIWL